MITNILEAMGLFMGKNQNPMQEARLFLNINRWILRESGGSWTRPESIDALLAVPAARKFFVEHMRFLLHSPQVADYLGWQRYFKFRIPDHMAQPWGWKDPQNTYTLPLWLTLYPNAKVVHIYRNGIDVASSLWVRSRNNMEELARKPVNRWWQQVTGKQIFPRIAGYITLEDGFRLWERYIQVADSHIVQLPAEQTRTICYEDFLQNPLPVLKDLCGFAGITIDPERMNAAAARINPSRRNAYEQNEELVKFYQQVKHSPQMIRYGYTREK